MDAPRSDKQRRSSGFIDGLLDAAAFPHAVENFELIETHISWVILTGEFAYKIKKPVDLGFVDFSSLDRRRYFCEEELRLNRRTAPDIYLEVVAIADTPDGLRVGQEPAVEYAVRMLQFPADAGLDIRLESGLLTQKDMLAVAEEITRFHDALPSIPDEGPAAEIAVIRRFALDNFVQIRSSPQSDTVHGLLSRIEAWTQDQLKALKPAFGDRIAGGFLREGHGDLHLANIIKFAGRIVLFDCLEFDPALRRLDLMNEIAFLMMDLMAHGREDLAFIFLNACLEQSGDYQGLEVLRFYLVYRCLVRAKVAAIQPRAESIIDPFDPAGKARRYLKLALSLTGRRAGPGLYLTHGFSGVGKTWLSNQLISGIPAIRIRSDLERKRLHGLEPGRWPSIAGPRFERVSTSSWMPASFATTIAKSFLTWL
jgi:aminoglycoside phosphotransferase family enzyme